jgi:hypothetical protein
MKLFDPLYARDSKGKILMWEVNVTNDQQLLKGPTNCSFINIYEGEKDGKRTGTCITVSKGKNIGKMNETTPYDQACSEAESRWNKKRKQGYKSMADLSIENLADLDIALPKDRTDENNLCKPMKAQPYFKDNGDVRIKFPCLGQAKLNGFRVMSRLEEIIEGEGLFTGKTKKITFRSKEGLRYTVLEHIEKDLEHILEYMIDKDTIFDGEIYLHGEILSEISSAVRKKNPKTSKLKFYIFDLAMENKTQNERFFDLEVIKNIIKSRYIENVVVVPNFPIGDNMIAQRFTDNQIKAGYEGAVFRDPKATYQFGKRPQTMVKLKRSQDKEFKVIDVVGGDNSPELGIFVCLAENGESFKCTPEGTKEQKAEYLRNKQEYIGKQLTVRFFERTKDSLPFHAVGVTIRDYE